MYNCLVSGFEDAEFQAFPIYKLENEGIINITKWIVKSEHGDINISNDKVLCWWDIVFNQDYHSDMVLTEAEMDYFFPKIHLLEQQLCREKLFELYTNYELRNIILKFVLYFKKILLKDNVEVVLFSDVPHAPYSMILYDVAKMLSLRTIFCMPTFFPGFTNLYNELEEIGDFSLTEQRMVLEKKYEKVLPYMKMPTFNDKCNEIVEKLCNFSGFINNRLNDFRKNQKIYGNLYGYIFLHLERSFKRKYQKHIYKKLYSCTFCENILDDKFVYFPLHLQPEMTTDTLGLEYFDQLLAIEKLRKILPEDWKIYVKENPKQGYYMRGKEFFDRLKSIPNIRCISKDISTYDLMKKCQFVATITGTAGWECISGGKPALIFGLAWYRYFSGITIYSDGVTVEKILANNVNHRLLERQINSLKKSSYEFCISKYDFEQVNPDINLNTQGVYDALKNKLLIM